MSGIRARWTNSGKKRNKKKIIAALAALAEKDVKRGKRRNKEHVYGGAPGCPAFGEGHRRRISHSKGARGADAAKISNRFRANPQLRGGRVGTERERERESLLCPSLVSFSRTSHTPGFLLSSVFKLGS